MKTLNITFDDQEYAVLVDKKNESKLSWHDFLLHLVENENRG